MENCGAGCLPPPSVLSDADSDKMLASTRLDTHTEVDGAVAQATPAAASGRGETMATDDAGKLDEIVDAGLKNAVFSEEWLPLQDLVASTVSKLNGRALVVIDCPTSRIAVVSKSLDRVKTLWKKSGSQRKFRILAFCHARFDMVAKV